MEDQQHPYLLGLQNLGRGKLNLGAENPVPEPACNTEPIVEVRKVMLKMILLELLVVWRKAGTKRQGQKIVH